MTDLVQRLREATEDEYAPAGLLFEAIAEIERLRAVMGDATAPILEAAKEIEELRREAELLRHERDVLQKICAKRADKIERLATVLDALADEAAKSVEYSDWPELQELVGKAFGAVARDGQP